MREAVNPGSWANRRIIGEVPFAMDLHLTLIRAYERAIHVVTRYFARWGLTPPSVQRHPHPVFAESDSVRLSDIGERLLQRVPDVSRLVDGLERAGLARRTRDP